MAKAGQATITRPITHAPAKAGGVSGTGHALKTAVQAHRNTAPVPHARQTHKQAPPQLPAWSIDSSGRWHQNMPGVSWAQFAGLGPQTGFASARGSGGTGFYSNPAPSPRAIAASSWNSGKGSGGSGFGGGQPAPHFSIGGGGGGFGGNGGGTAIPGGSGGGSGAPDGTGGGAQPDSGGGPTFTPDFNYTVGPTGITGDNQGGYSAGGQPVPRNSVGDAGGYEAYTSGFGPDSYGYNPGGGITYTQPPGTVPATGPDTSSGFPGSDSPDTAANRSGFF